MIAINEKEIAAIKRVTELTGTKLPIPRDLNEELPIRVTLVGQPQQNLFEILHGVFGGFDFLNRSFLHGYRATVRFGDVNRIMLGNEEVSKERIAKTLSSFESVKDPITFTLEMNNAALQGLELRIIASENDFADIEWIDFFANADYCFFTLSATALLSMAERKVLREWLKPYMGEQLGILLTNDHLILEEDRPDVDSSLERFLEGKTQVFRLPDADEERIRTTLGGLREKVAEIRKLRYDRTCRLSLCKALEEVNLQIQVLSDDAQKIDEAIELLNEKAKEISGREESTCRRLRMHFTSPLRVNATEEISTFQQKLMDKLHSEINGNESIDAMQSMIPDYIRDQWSHEADKVTDIIKSAAAEMEQELTAYITEDIREYLAEDADHNTAEYVIRLTDMYVDKEFTVDENSFHFMESFDNSKLKRYGVIASGVALVLMSHPIIGASVAFFGSRKIKKLEASRVLQENRQSLIQATDEMCREAYDDMLVWLDGMITAIENSIAACVEECYQKMMATMIKALNNKKDDRNTYSEQLAALNSMKTEIQNELK